MNLVDYRGNQIKIIKEIKNNSQLAILYPGYRYTLDAPIFFYLQELLAKSNFDIIGFDYRYSENEYFLNSTDEEKKAWFQYDCNAIGRVVNDFSKTYRRLLYIGKSLGTTVLMNQLKNNLIQENSEIIYLTPGAEAQEIYLTIQKSKNRTLIIYGTADKFYNKTYIDYIKDKTNVHFNEIKNAGHVFEEEGNIRQSILNIADVIDSIYEFIKN
ncbi:MAG: hypothetical protein NUV32_09120 [Exilispira sp.]|jgi:predicted alpha/beta-fold hydrolase|nr:hypothetical protein [Exilispira sp.]